MQQQQTTQAGMFHAPWAQHAAGGQQPMPQAAPWAQYAANGQQPMPPADVHTYQAPGSDWDLMRLWRIDRRNTHALTTFDGTMNAFKVWRDRMVQHTARTNPNWVTVLSAVQKKPQAIDMNEARNDNCQGVPADNLGVEVYNVITEWVADAVFKSRRKYAPEHHGFELRRRLHQQRPPCTAAGRGALRWDWRSAST